MVDRAKHLLRTVFGYDTFLSLQEGVIANLLEGRDTLAVMPTGGGKSLCYQIPALLLEGLTVVVSPLIALMKDQVEQLTEAGVPAVVLNSSLSPGAYRSNVERMRRGEVKLLYAAPETLLKPAVSALLESLPVSCLAIDEAHCISEWGPDFRPEYRELARLRALLPGAVCVALTATATPRVRADIRSCLGLSASNEFVASFDRENLLIRIVPKESPQRQVMDIIRRYPGESGIVYCLTRKRVEKLCAALQAQGIAACAYHAGLPEAERSRNQERFVRDEARVMVATIAFGMGINKSNVRFVVHHDLPKSIESYYQEIGRAGRDGLPSECLLLFSYGDIHKARALIGEKGGLEGRVASLQLNAMVQLAESEICRRVPLLQYFGETYGRERCGLCDNCLAGERELVDLTIAAQKFLSCVKRTGERFGTMHIISVLRGSTAEKVMRFGHDRLSTYGIGKDLTQRQWQQVARQLLHKGLMVQDPELGGLSLTPRAWEVFRGHEMVLGRLDTAEEPPAAALRGGRESDPASGAGRELFEALRQKRRALADAANVPAYVIFSDRTLADMAARLPRDLAAMRTIHGVGEVKLERYGDDFLEIIRTYCDSRPEGGGPEVAAGTPDPPRRGRIRRERELAVGEAFNAGCSIESLAEAHGVQPRRILLHLYHYAQEGHALRAERLLPLITIPETLREEALEAFQRFGGERLKPVYEALGGRVSYEELKLIGIYFQACRNAH